MTGQSPGDRPLVERLYDVGFVCDQDPDAQRVFLLGDFNNWDPAACAMVKEGAAFRATLRLHSGTYTYKFLIDGEERHDPRAEQQVWKGPSDMRSIVRVPVQ